MTGASLDAILSATRGRIAGLRSRAGELERRAAAAPPPRSFTRALHGEGDAGQGAGAGAGQATVGVIALATGRLQARARTARDHGLGVLVEVHSEAELDEALAAEPTAVGVNSRDLATFVVDLRIAEALLARVPAGVPAVAESGIEARADVERMAAVGADLVLVGTSVARSEDPAAAVRALTGVARRRRRR